MAFASDRDCVAMEPGVMSDAAWTGQRLLSSTGGVSGTTLTLDAGGVDLEAAGIGAGHVVLVAGVALEVVSRDSATTATVSRVRESLEASAIPPGDSAGVKVEVYSFASVLGTVHRQVLRMAGIDPDDPSVGALGESDVVNGGSLRELEAAGALHLVYSAASAAGPIGGEMERRARAWRDRFWAERQRARVLVDLDGDGEADAARRLNSVRFVRG
ncbi:MAG: hypothetical protein ACI89L_001913 [Phycisphaerales bacterium]|jgi:hypothetical protein